MPKLQLLRLLGRIAGGQDLEAKVACSRWRAGRLVLGNLAEGHVGKDPENLPLPSAKHMNNLVLSPDKMVFQNYRLPVLITRKKLVAPLLDKGQGSVPNRLPVPSGLQL